MDKINAFEKTNQTVANFNAIFDVKLTNLCDTLQVEIGELADTDTTRFLTVGNLIVKHNFTTNRTEDVIDYTL
jgi:hypothetical protein